MWRVLMVLCAGLMLAAGASAETEEKSNKAALDEMFHDYIRAFNAGDYERVASYWTEDAVHLPPGAPEIRGRAALKEFYRETFESLKPQIGDHDYECRFAGDHAFVRESWTITFQSRDREPVSRTGKGLLILRREPDGIWRTFWALGRLDEPETEAR